MAAPAEPCIIISTSDDEQFTVEKKVIERSALIKSMMDGQSPFLCGRLCGGGAKLWVSLVQTRSSYQVAM